MACPIDGTDDATDDVDIGAAKRELRRSMRMLRRDLDGQAERSRRVWARLQGMPAVRDADVVMAFDSIVGEPDTAPFVAWCRAEGKRVVLPAADPTAAFPKAVERIDVVLVPGVAFTVDGDRLGQGGGWYDRLIATTRPDCVTIGVCFVEQIVDVVPVESHDRRLDHVVTDADPT